MTTTQNTTPSAKNGEACCQPTCCQPNEAPRDAASPSSSKDAIRTMVRETYGKAVKAVVEGAQPSCCDSKAKVLKGVDPITRDLYSTAEASEVPADALLASFGCGNPTAVAELTAGETVLDLGSGGGIDVLLSARRVGPQGKAYGLDMTSEMLELARRNQQTAGVTNAEFLQGTIEAIPLPDSSVDVVISNCVINLSSDKDQALQEAFRVLRHGGRFAVFDIVLRRELGEEAKKSIELWAACIAGALLESEYRAKLLAAGFLDVEIEPTRIYTRKDAQEITKDAGCCGTDAESQLQALDGAAVSAFIRARKA
jgi:arsenite methyltransferase